MANPKLPPILINKAGSVYYVYTSFGQSSWKTPSIFIEAT